MYVDEAKASACETVRLDEGKHFLIARNPCRRQRLKKCQDLRSVPEVAARKLSDDERVSQDPAGIEEPPQLGAALREVSDPNGGVDKDGHQFLLS